MGIFKVLRKRLPMVAEVEKARRFFPIARRKEGVKAAIPCPPEEEGTRRLAGEERRQSRCTPSLRLALGKIAFAHPSD